MQDAKHNQSINQSNISFSDKSRRYARRQAQSINHLINQIFHLQINHVDMQDAKHNQAVALLTGTEADVHLKVYREHLVIKNVR